MAFATIKLKIGPEQLERLFLENLNIDDISAKVKILNSKDPQKLFDSLVKLLDSKEEKVVGRAIWALSEIPLSNERKKDAIGALEDKYEKLEGMNKARCMRSLFLISGKIDYAFDALRNDESTEVINSACLIFIDEKYNSGAIGLVKKALEKHGPTELGLAVTFLGMYIGKTKNPKKEYMELLQKCLKETLNADSDYSPGGQLSLWKQYLKKDQYSKLEMIVKDVLIQDSTEKGNSIIEYLGERFGINLKNTSLNKKVVTKMKNPKDGATMMYYRPMWINRIEIFKKYASMGNAINYKTMVHEIMHMLADEKRGALQLGFPKALDEGFPEYFAVLVTREVLGRNEPYAYEGSNYAQIAEKIAKTIGDQKAIELFLNGRWKEMRKLYDNEKGRGAFTKLLNTANHQYW